MTLCCLNFDVITVPLDNAFSHFSSQGILNSGYVMIMEMFPPEKRNLAGSLCNVVWAISITLVSPLAYGLPNWRHYQMLVSLICLVMLPAWW